MITKKQKVDIMMMKQNLFKAKLIKQKQEFLKEATDAVNIAMAKLIADSDDINTMFVAPGETDILIVTSTIHGEEAESDLELVDLTFDNIRLDYGYFVDDNCYKMETEILNIPNTAKAEFTQAHQMYEDISEVFEEMVLSLA